mmetsp:Transcript_20661/g.29661  ORF Transcript_20661/g.29661 Transcript_20661/m.29661 type:complete len:122 (+) Transcript_20661:595-960(+)
MTIGHLLNPKMDSTARDSKRKLKCINHPLIGNKSIFVGDKMRGSDLCLYIALTWSSYVKNGLSKVSVALSYRERIGNLPEIRDTHAAIAYNPVSMQLPHTDIYKNTTVLLFDTSCWWVCGV